MSNSVTMGLHGIPGFEFNVPGNLAYRRREWKMMFASNVGKLLLIVLNDYFVGRWVGQLTEDLILMHTSSSKADYDTQIALTCPDTRDTKSIKLTISLYSTLSAYLFLALLSQIIMWAPRSWVFQ